MKNKFSKTAIVSGILSLFLVLVALLAPWIANEATEGVFPLVKFGPESIDLFKSEILGAPDSQHFMGTDNVGRDVFSRLVHGIKNSLLFSVAVVIICTLIGMIIGGIMGFFGGWIDLVMSRIMEVIGNFPIMLLMLTLLAIIPTQTTLTRYGLLLFVMCLAGWIPYCRYTRAEFLKLRDQDFVTAAIAVGSSRRRLFFKHLFPNSLTPIIIYVPFDLSITITSLGFLSFLGFGEPINVASLGELLKQAKDHFREAWWIAVYPGGVLFLLTFSLALFGSSVRDILDPRSAETEE